jgi:Protein of unknown function (DUF3829)
MVWGMPMRVALVALALAGCSKPRQSRSGVHGDTAENQALMHKLDGYLKCHADHSLRVFRLADIYRKQFEHGPPTNGAAVALAAPGEPLDCVAAIDRAQRLLPAVPALDAAGIAYRRALLEVYRVTKSYDQNQAAALHEPLLAAFTAFDKAEGALFDQLYTLNHGVHVTQHAQRAAKEGRTREIVLEGALLAAEDMARHGRTPVTALDGINIGELTASTAKLELALEELATFQTSELDPVDSAGLRTQLADGRQVTIAGHQLAQRARDKTAYSTTESLMIAAGNEADVAGTPAALAAAYNRFVEIR